MVLKITNIKGLSDEEVRKQKLFKGINVSTPLPIQKLDSSKYIYKTPKSYRIIKKINGKTHNYGNYPTLGEAMKIRDKLVLNNWEKDKVIPPKDTSKQYITKSYDKYQISKVLRGKRKSFGSYNTLEEAKLVRDKLILNNWDVCVVPKKITRRPRNGGREQLQYIRSTTNKYYVQKEVNKKRITFYQTYYLERAKIARDWWVEHDWNTILLQQFKRNNDWSIIFREYDTYGLKYIHNIKKTSL